MSQFTQDHPTHRNADFAMPVSICHVPKVDKAREAMIAAHVAKNDCKVPMGPRCKIALEGEPATGAQHKAHKQAKLSQRIKARRMGYSPRQALGKFWGQYRSEMTSGQVAEQLRALRTAKLSYASLFAVAQEAGMPLQAIEIVGDSGEVLETWEKDLAPGNLFLNSKDLRLGFVRLVPVK